MIQKLECHQCSMSKISHCWRNYAFLLIHDITGQMLCPKWYQWFWFYWCYGWSNTSLPYRHKASLWSDPPLANTRSNCHFLHSPWHCIFAGTIHSLLLYDVIRGYMTTYLKTGSTVTPIRGRGKRMGKQNSRYMEDEETPMLVSFSDHIAIY